MNTSVLYERLDRTALVEIVTEAEKRTVDEEITLLYNNNMDPSGWLLRQLASDEMRGISGSDDDFEQRRIDFGTNRKEPAKPPSFCSLLL